MPPTRRELIEARTKLLNLDVPPPLRYFLWLGALFRGDFGVSIQNQPVNALLGNAITSTLTLVTTATVVAIILGLTVGIVSALRQYTGFDYGVTLIAFLFFSLPIFWVAVLLKQYGAIRHQRLARRSDDLGTRDHRAYPSSRVSSGCRSSAASGDAG